MYPARTVESDVVLLGSEERKFITKNIRYEDSDHHTFDNKYDYPRWYPRLDELNVD
jgi:hypothetical protein